MPEKISLVVVDDHPLYRSGVVQTLAEAADMVVLAEGGSAPEAIELVAKARPRIVLLDISMPGDGKSAAQSIARNYPDTIPVMLTASEQDEDILEALEAGARGNVLKGVGAHELLAVVRTVAAGGSYVSPSLAGKLLVTMKARERNGPEIDPLATLSAREEEIPRLVAKGRSNKEVGRELDLQEKTIKHYMTGILQKLQVRNRTQAAGARRRPGPCRSNQRSPSGRGRRGR